MLHKLKSNKNVVGTKQTQKALESNEAKVVYIANDADDRVIRRVRELAKEQELPVVAVETMVKLGGICNIEVKTATAAIIN